MNIAPAITIGIFWVFIILAWTLMFTKGAIISYFHLVDKRSMVSGEETYQKLNQLMVAGEVSLYSHKFMGEYSVTLSVDYQGESKEESVSNRFRGKDINTAIAEAYDWSVQRGYIKE